MTNNWQQLFTQHQQYLQKNVTAILEKVGFEQLVIGAGSLHYYFEDDQSTPFRVYHHFAHWCPIEGEEHVIVFKPGQKPKLYFYEPKDFWHEFLPIGNPFWAASFDIISCDKVETINQELKALKKAVYIGPDVARAASLGLATEVPSLKPQLNWMRSQKTEYEIACLKEANALGAKGHKAALQAFQAGGSELDIHYEFVKATGTLERDLSYETIVALNEKGATLHYKDKRSHVRDGKVLLIDAGAKFQHYGSDITRTYARTGTHPVFISLIEALNTLQIKIANSIMPGMTMVDLHDSSHVGIAKILLDHGILKDCTAEAAIQNEFTRAFYPHGLGHMLGIFVHDVGGDQQDPMGTPSVKSTKYPKLRSTRRLDVGNCVTVEPGLYFIPMLLEPFQKNEFAKHFDWEKIKSLLPCGGIRIEDDVVVTATGVMNLTRPFLP